MVPRPAFVHGTISTVPALSAIMFHVDWEVFGHLRREPQPLKGAGSSAHVFSSLSVSLPFKMGTSEESSSLESKTKTECIRLRETKRRRLTNCNSFNCLTREPQSNHGIYLTIVEICKSCSSTFRVPRSLFFRRQRMVVVSVVVSIVTVRYLRV